MTTPTSPQAPPPLSDGAKKHITLHIARGVDAHPGQAANTLAAYDKAVAAGATLAEYDEYSRTQLREQLRAKGRCRMCGRKLKDPDADIGPECVKKVGADG